jgi:thiamine biosynthesis lipoprotein ApbE
VVVVTALNPADAEVLSTALMAAQCGRREKLLAEFPGAEAQFFDNL